MNIKFKSKIPEGFFVSKPENNTINIIEFKRLTSYLFNLISCVQFLRGQKLKHELVSFIIKTIFISLNAKSMLI